MPFEWLTMGFAPVLPSEQCAVYIANQKIMSLLYPTLLEKWHEDTVREYLLSRHGTYAERFLKIKWRSMKYALGQLSYHHRATAVKSIHHHLPTQDKLYKQGRVTMCAICPRCLATEETNAHVYQCNNKEDLNH